MVLFLTGLALAALLGFLLLIPFGMTVYSMLAVYSFPAQIIKLAGKPLVRKNHALEHATINILERKYGYQRLAGFSEEDGYYIFGCDDPKTLEEAAREGLERLINGELKLAIHRQCGTSAGVANFLMALIFLVSVFFLGFASFFFLAAIILLAAYISPYLGEIVQELFTISTDVKDMKVENLEFRVFNPLKTARTLETHPFITTTFLGQSQKKQNIASQK